MSSITDRATAVFDAFNNETIPGCEHLNQDGPSQSRVTMCGFCPSEGLRCQPCYDTHVGSGVHPAANCDVHAERLAVADESKPVDVRVAILLPDGSMTAYYGTVHIHQVVNWCSACATPPDPTTNAA